MAPRAILQAAAQKFAALRDIKVDTEAAGGVDVARRIEAREAADVVVLAGDAIDKLIVGGHLAKVSRRDLMKSGIAVAVRAGDAHPDLGTEQTVRQAVESAATISYSTGPSGRYLESLFQRWGVYQQIRDRIVVPPPGTPVASLIAAGKVALGFQQLSELLGVSGIDVVGPLPPAVQQFTIFTGAASVASAHGETVDDFLTYLASPAVDSLKQKFGMAGV